MKEKFGCLPTGEQTYLYSIKNGSMEAYISDLGATLVRLYVPDREGNRADVVLGFDNYRRAQCQPDQWSCLFFKRKRISPDCQSKRQ